MNTTRDQRSEYQGLRAAYPAAWVRADDARARLAAAPGLYGTAEYDALRHERDEAYDALRAIHDRLGEITDAVRRASWRWA